MIGFNGMGPNWGPHRCVHGCRVPSDHWRRLIDRILPGFDRILPGSDDLVAVCLIWDCFNMTVKLALERLQNSPQGCFSFFRKFRRYPQAKHILDDRTGEKSSFHVVLKFIFGHEPVLLGEPLDTLHVSCPLKFNQLTSKIPVWKNKFSFEL